MTRKTPQDRRHQRGRRSWRETLNQRANAVEVLVKRPRSERLLIEVFDDHREAITLARERFLDARLTRLSDLADANMIRWNKDRDGAKSLRDKIILDRNIRTQSGPCNGEHRTPNTRWRFDGRSREDGTLVDAKTRPLGRDAKRAKARAKARKRATPEVFVKLEHSVAEAAIIDQNKGARARRISAQRHLLDSDTWKRPMDHA
jgi:hypothetical protein